MKTLIKNGRVIDPANATDTVLDVLVDGSRIEAVARGISGATDQVIDASGKIVMPGLVDMHVHLREPGREDKETVASGTAAALAGGVTSVLAMPNTFPALDSPDIIAALADTIEKTARVHVYICAAITKGRLGKELTDIALLARAGALALSDDGGSVDDDKLFEEALKKAHECGMRVICHSEDRALSAGGVVNLGYTSTRLGLRGISRESEYKRVERDIMAAERTQTAVHIAHVSCRESVEIIAAAKKRGVSVTCETAPHYFSLSEEATWGYNTNTKVNPPLRGRDDVAAIREGLRNGTIDAIASDHAPHTENEKDVEFDRAEFGAIGLETELAVSITELIQNDMCDWLGLARLMSFNPAKILGLKKGSLARGADADIVIVDPAKKWVFERGNIISKSKNSPFIGHTLTGLVETTIIAGKIAYQR